MIFHITVSIVFIYSVCVCVSVCRCACYCGLAHAMVHAWLRGWNSSCKLALAFLPAKAGLLLIPDSAPHGSGQHASMLLAFFSLPFFSLYMNGGVTDVNRPTHLFFTWALGIKLRS